ncbi:glycerophosphodiester phosphodiesterase [Arthrobacter sp. HLT1-21]
MSASLSRRQFILGASGGLVLAGCSVPSPGEKSRPINTVDDLLADEVFYVAHRGSMDNWPEHTVEAYQQAVAAGATAIEVSVSATADRQLVCHHDLTTLRMTGADRVIADTTYDELAGLLNDARPWLGDKSLLLPIPLLHDVLTTHATHSVVFIEDKQRTNTAALLDLMDTYPHPTRHFVWKQPALAEVPPEVTRRGYKTWGYLTNEDFDVVAAESLQGLAQRHDLLGIHHSAPNELITKLVQTGTPVVVWEVHTRSLRDRLMNLGVRGMMCSNIPYVTTADARASADVFATGLRGAGDLPWALAWTHQPEIISSGSSILLSHGDKASYCMGSLCPVPASSYSINFEMRWPDSLPRDGDHAGLAFGQRDDSPYRVREPSSSGGYHMILRSDGELVLFGRVADEIDGYELGRTSTAQPVTGVWMSFQIDVSAESIRCSRTDGEGGSVSVSSDVYRGGYFSLCRNYFEYPPVEFRAVTVT